MKSAVLILIILAIVFSIRQRWIIHQLRDDLAIVPKVKLIERNERHRSQAFSEIAIPPIGAVSSSDYFNDLVLINDLKRPEDRANFTFEWISTLTTVEALHEALNVLLQETDSHSDKTILLGRFGPALLAQWGRIAPQDGLSTWYSLDRKIRQNFLGEDCSARDEFYINNSVSPLPLLESWVGHDVDGLIQALPELPPGAGGDVFKILSRSHPMELLLYLDNVEHFKPVILKDMGAWASPIGNYMGPMWEFDSGITNHDVRSVFWGVWMDEIAKTMISEHSSSEAIHHSIPSELGEETRKKFTKHLSRLVQKMDD